MSNAHKNQRKVPVLLLEPILVGLAIFGLALALWFGLRMQERVQAGRQIAMEADKAASLVEENLKLRVPAIQRMAHRWVVRGGTPKAEWLGDAHDLMLQQAGCVSIQWIDETHLMRWIVPGDHHAVSTDLEAVAEIQTARAPVLRLGTLSNGRRGMHIYAPVSVGGQFDGCIRAVYDLDTWLGTTLSGIPMASYSMEISDQGTALYRRGDAEPGLREDWAQSATITCPGVYWKVDAWPSDGMLGVMLSGWPRTVLLVGGLLSLLVAWTVRIAGVSRRQYRRLSHEVEERRRTEMELQESEHRFAQLSRTIDDVFWSRSLDGSRFFFASEAFQRIWAFDAESLYADAGLWTKRIHPDDRERVAERFQADAARGAYDVVYRIEVKDELRWIRDRGTPVRNACGKVDRVVGIAQDITGMKEVESALRESNAQAHALIQNMPFAIFLKDTDSRFIAVNQAMAEALNAKPDDILGKTDADFAPPDLAALYVAGDRQIIQHQKHLEFEERMVIHGHERLMQTIKSPVLDDAGEVIGVLGMTRDITEQVERRSREREIQERLARAGRLEMVGQLAGGVAHDLNNILGPVVGYPDMILEDLPSDSPVRHDVVQIKDSAMQAAAVIQDLLALSRRGNYQLEPTSLNEVVLSYQRSAACRELLEKYPNIRLDVELETDPPVVEGSAPHLNQVMLNLIINAFEAIDGHGVVEVSAEHCRLDEGYNGYEPVEAGHYSILRVRDTGPGIADAHIEHIFEPFYTRKRMGRSGTGLGLAVVYGIVKDHGGCLDVVSAPGAGTEFIIYIPQTLAVPETRSTDIEQYVGSESVLVVDDVPQQRDLAARLLKRLGYQVWTAEHGHAALEFLEDRKVDLVVLDMIMEDGFDGLDTYLGVIERYPGQPTIIASGFAETTRVKEAQRLGAGEYLRKPYTVDNLGRAVRVELDRYLARDTGESESA